MSARPVTFAVAVVGTTGSSPSAGSSPSSGVISSATLLKSASTASRSASRTPTSVAVFSSRSIASTVTSFCAMVNVTGISFAAYSSLPACATVIVTSPAPTIVTTPSAVTVATFSSELVKVNSVSPEASSGVTSIVKPSSP